MRKFLNMKTRPRERGRVLRRGGFTLIEVLIVIGILAILAGIVLVAINPARQFAQARNSQRVSNVNAILNAIGQRMADNRGVFETGCAAGPAPAASENIASGDYDIGPCLVPIYLAQMPFDPNAEGAHFTSLTDYDTKYSVERDAATSRIKVSAPAAELNEIINVTR